MSVHQPDDGMTALCNQNKIEDSSSTPSSFSYDANYTWKDGDGDLIFKSYNGGTPVVLPLAVA